MEEQNEIEPVKELTQQEKLAKENNLIEEHPTATEFENILQTKQSEVSEQDTKPIDIKQSKNLQKYQPVPLTPLQGFATVLMILGIILAFYTLFVSVSFILLLLFYLILIVGIILSLFTLLFNEEYMTLFQSGNQVAAFLSQLSPTLPYTYGISFGLFLISMILFGVSKKGKKRTAGMVVSGVLMGIELIIGLIILIGFQGIAAA